MIKDCGIYFNKSYNNLPILVQNIVWRDVAKFVLALINGIDHIQMQHDTSSGTELPPVSPHDLIKLQSHKFNAFIVKQNSRIITTKTRNEIEIIQK
jgi:hypothetical protein